jgi:hypothetical protein
MSLCSLVDLICGFYISINIIIILALYPIAAQFQKVIFNPIEKTGWVAHQQNNLSPTSSVPSDPAGAPTHQQADLLQSDDPPPPPRPDPGKQDGHGQ